MTPQAQIPQQKTIPGNIKWLVLGAICVITFFCFQRTLHNQFSNWDDDVYVSNDTIIRTLTPAHLKTIFTEDITKNNYHPFCMLSLAINYQFAKLQPTTYYLTNILIHIANVILIFFLLTALGKLIKLKENDVFLIAALGAFWFGVHPLHVESVSWIAERKDVLYTFFYLWGLWVYTNSLINSKNKNLVVFLLFLASCLSKPMAVVFPLSMLAIDFLAGRKIEWKRLTEKTLFFVAALVMGSLAFYTQNKTGAIAAFSKLTLMERFMYASYGFDMYVFKFFNPTFLSTFYPYPYRFTDGTLPFIYYAAPFIAITILTLPVYIAYKSNSLYLKVVGFGIGFYLVNVIFVLQFISVGAAIMADRYSYVSSIGLIFMVAFFVVEIPKRYPVAKNAVLVLVLASSACLCLLCYQRTAVWHNSETLESDAIKKYPFRALLSYKWLGNYYMDKHDTDKALAKEDTDKAIENYKVLADLRAADAKTYDRLGNIYLWRSDYQGALDLYNKAAEAEGNVYISYVDKSVVYAALGDSVNSIKSYVQAVQLNKQAEQRLAEICFNMVQAKKFKPAIMEYNLLLLFNPNNPYYYFYRGVSKFSTDQLNNSIVDFTTALKFKNPEVDKVASFNLAIACDSVGDGPHAEEYYNMAMKLGAPPQKGFLDKVHRKEGR